MGSTLLRMIRRYLHVALVAVSLLSCPLHAWRAAHAAAPDASAKARYFAASIRLGGGTATAVRQYRARDGRLITVLVTAWHVVDDRDTVRDPATGRAAQLHLLTADRQQDVAVLWTDGLSRRTAVPVRVLGDGVYDAYSVGNPRAAGLRGLPVRIAVRGARITIYAGVIPGHSGGGIFVDGALVGVVHSRAVGQERSYGTSLRPVASVLTQCAGGTCFGGLFGFRQPDPAPPYEPPPQMPGPQAPETIDWRPVTERLDRIEQKIDRGLKEVGIDPARVADAAEQGAEKAVASGLMPHISQLAARIDGVASAVQDVRGQIREVDSYVSELRAAAENGISDEEMQQLDRKLESIWPGIYAVLSAVGLGFLGTIITVVWRLRNLPGVYELRREIREELAQRAGGLQDVLHTALVARLLGLDQPEKREKPKGAEGGQS